MLIPFIFLTLLECCKLHINLWIFFFFFFLYICAIYIFILVSTVALLFRENKSNEKIALDGRGSKEGIKPNES